MTVYQQLAFEALACRSLELSGATRSRHIRRIFKSALREIVNPGAVPGQSSDRIVLGDPVLVQKRNQQMRG